MLRAQPGKLLGVLMSVGGLSAAVSSVALRRHLRRGHRPRQPAGGDTRRRGRCLLWLPGFLVLIAALPVLFPHGELPSPRWRWPARGALLAVPAIMVLAATTQTTVDDSGFATVDNPLDLPVRDSLQMGVAAALFGPVVALGATATISVLLRMRRADRPARQQYAWFVAAVLLAAVAAFGPWPDVVALAVNAASIAALAVGIVRQACSTSRSRCPGRSSTRR